MTTHSVAVAKLTSKLLGFITLFFVFLAFGGCTTPQTFQSLNDKSRSVSNRNVAPFGNESKNILYEYKRSDDISVGYNISFKPKNPLIGYRLTLTFTNLNAETLTIQPDIDLRDNSGYLISPYDRAPFIEMAANYAGVEVPYYALNNNSGNYYHSGTVTSSTGNTYRYYGQSSSGKSFSSGFQSGVSQGAMIVALAYQKVGRNALGWASAYWLRSEYTIPPRSSVSGALYYPALDINQLPLNLTVKVNNQDFKFITSDKTNN